MGMFESGERPWERSDMYEGGGEVWRRGGEWVIVEEEEAGDEEERWSESSVDWEMSKRSIAFEM